MTVGHHPLTCSNWKPPCERRYCLVSCISSSQSKLNILGSSVGILWGHLYPLAAPYMATPWPQVLTFWPATGGSGISAGSNIIGQSNQSSIRSTFAFISHSLKCLKGIRSFGPTSIPNVDRFLDIRTLNMKYCGSSPICTAMHETLHGS